MTRLNQNSESPVSAEQIRLRLIDALAREMQLSPDELRSDQPLTALGVDSMQFIGLIGELEEWLGCRILANPLPKYPTVDALAAWLAAELAAGRSQLDPNRTA